MALFDHAKLAFGLIFIACCYLTVTLAEVPVDCCLSVRNATVPKKMVVDYHRQVGGQGCTCDATILVTRGQVRLCVPADEPWVENVVAHVKDLRKCCSHKGKCKRTKGQRCRGVKPVSIQEVKL